MSSIPTGIFFFHLVLLSLTCSPGHRMVACEVEA